MATLKSIKNKYLSASDGAVLGVTTNTENISALSFKLATADSLSKFNLVDGFADNYNDATGVDAATSTNDIRSDDGYYRGGTAGTVTGGTITTHGDYKVHTFTVGGNFITDVAGTADILLVGGGGSSGGGHYNGGAGGGGGGGGVRQISGEAISAATHAVVVGAGATGSQYGANGVASTFSGGYTASGGGGGGFGTVDTPDSRDGLAGASGGGGGYGTVAKSGGAGNTPSTSPAQGYPGGNAAANGAGGGGGSGVAGTNAPGSGNNGGPGGNGQQNDWQTGSNQYYAGGGGGSGQGGGVGIPGGLGGGGASGYGGSNVGTAGTVNTGGGGGGSHGANGSHWPGASGGSGIVIIRYLAASGFTSSDDLTLQSNSFTAQAAPTTARIVMDELTSIGGTTLNTDLKAYASRDNGTTFTQMTLADSGYLNPNSGIDGYTKLLLHCDGSNNGTTFTDSSFSGHIVTANANAVTDTTYKKFGTAGYKCPATGDFLSIPDSADFNFGSGDFTIDAWLYRTGTSSYQTIAQHETDGSNYWQWRYFGSGGNITFSITGTGAFTVSFGCDDSTFPVNTWVHHQMVRSGNSWYLFQDGVQTGTTQTQAAAIPDMTGSLYLQGSSALSQPFVGYMDEFRISKGIARNTSNFVVPSGEYVQSRRLLSGSVDVSGQPSGTSVKYKLTTHNQSASKETRIYGTSMAWA